ncbi:class E sortase [Actinomadura rubrisoli]|uniref:Class E sortase n=1 Tax=Actinomadura rubrisoli TaxID=2530368 RepID=A0A4R5C4I5_9ACTN|nr:class E sortase [Actinomadura rubrisoli]TDD93875.1 class E sortase [Actinomadura rubrisoli]
MLDRRSLPALVTAAASCLAATGAPQAHAEPARPAVVTATPAAPSRPAKGEVIGKIGIKRIGLKARVLRGISRGQLQKGAGHYPGTAFPGREGNTVLLGHRTTWLAPFRRINELRRGDPIVLRVGRTSYVYKVKATRIIRPTDRRALEAVPFKRESTPHGRYITLITCHPKGSDRQRLVVVGTLHHTTKHTR